MNKTHIAILAALALGAGSLTGHSACPLYETNTI